VSVASTQPQRRARVVPRRGDLPSPARTTPGARSDDNRTVPCHGIEGLYSGHEVNIGYRPYRTTRPTAIRVACDPTADAVVELRAGQGLGRQTVRNPDHDDSPPDRPAAGPADGWIWVYARQQGGSGWIPLDDVEPWHSPPGRPCKGPAGFDFEPGVMPTKHGPHTSCGTRAIGPARLRARVVAAADVYIRYSPAGTAWDYLLRGDRVELRCHGPRGFDGVTIVSSRYLPAGATGWATAGVLRRD
jgi:hypothetical protein